MTETNILPAMMIVIQRHTPPFLRLSLNANSSLKKCGIDSMNAVNLLLDIESTFSVRFPESMLTSEVFATPASLEEAVVRLLEQQGHA